MKTKILELLLALLPALPLALSCDTAGPTAPAAPRLSAALLRDFSDRHAGAQVIGSVIGYVADGTGYEGDETRVEFVDADGIPGVALYRQGEWLMTAKSPDKRRFADQIPFQVYMTYLSTGIRGEDYGSDNSYIYEIRRNGMDGTFYHFHVTAPYDDGKRSFENLSYDVLIGEDGQLLALEHACFNNPVWWEDIRSSIRIVRGKYPDALLLGAANDGGDNLFYIDDNGCDKTVRLRNLADWTWTETRFRLPDDTLLPEEAQAACAAYVSEHEGAVRSALYHVDTPSGAFYGIRFGNDLENTLIYTPIPESVSGQED